MKKLLYIFALALLSVGACAQEDNLGNGQEVSLGESEAGTSLGQGQANAMSWEAANAAYAAGNYEAAIAGYEALLQTEGLAGETRAEVLYNLGNSLFKTGENARAILAYERCLRLNPGHKDAQYNLEFAEQRIVDNIEDHHQFFLLQWAQSVRGWAGEGTWLLWSVVLFVLCIVGMLVFAFGHQTAVRKSAFYTGVVALCVAILTFWAGMSLHHRDMAQEEAIIVQGVVNAKSSPDKSGTDLFVLHEGTKVRIGDVVGEWCEIRVGDHIGWIRQSALERI